MTGGCAFDVPTIPLLVGPVLWGFSTRPSIPTCTCCPILDDGTGPAPRIHASSGGMSFICSQEGLRCVAIPSTLRCVLTSDPQPACDSIADGFHHREAVLAEHHAAQSRRTAHVAANQASRRGGLDHRNVICGRTMLRIASLAWCVSFCWVSDYALTTWGRCDSTVNTRLKHPCA